MPQLQVRHLRPQDHMFTQVMLTGDAKWLAHFCSCILTLIADFWFSRNATASTPFAVLAQESISQKTASTLMVKLGRALKS